MFGQLPQSNSDTSTRLVSLEAQLNDLSERTEIRFIDQEHRLFHILRNTCETVLGWKLPVITPRRWVAALSSLVHWFLKPSTVIVSGVGLLGVLIGIHANYLLGSQNAKIDSQNKLLDTQNSLIEAERRSAIVFELSSIQDKILSEPGGSQSAAEGSPRVLTDTLIGRIVALSRSLRPYRYLERRQAAVIAPASRPAKAALVANSIQSLLGLPAGPTTVLDDNYALIERPLSPERSQLLLSLLAANVDMNSILNAGAVFAFASLEGVDFSSRSATKLQNANLEGADLTGAILYRMDLAGSNLREAKLRNADLARARLDFCILESSNLQDAILTDAELNVAYLAKADLRGANMRNASLYQADLSGAMLEGAILKGAKYTRDTKWPPGFDAARLKQLGAILENN